MKSPQPRRLAAAEGSITYHRIHGASFFSGSGSSELCLKSWSSRRLAMWSERPAVQGTSKRGATAQQAMDRFGDGEGKWRVEHGHMPK